MRVALVQNIPRFGKKEENIDRLFALMDREAADVYILPELAYTGYQFVSRKEVEELADSLDAPSIQRFKEKAGERGSAIVFGFPERAEEGFYNSSLAVLPDGQTVLYRKTHLFYKEKLYFLPGNTGFPLFSFRGVRIGMAICFDWFFPESFRTLALGGADLIAHCSNLVMPYCQQADFAQALMNRVYIATANRTGTEFREEESLTFTGESVLVSPRGEYLLRGPEEGEAILSCDIDPELARNKKINPYNEVFMERRPEFYTLHP
ncbi:MAG: nitrilase [Spirochaetales bacterium]